MVGRRKAHFLAVAAIAVATACGGNASAPKIASSTPNGVVASNVTRADYAGSAACETCHADIAASWAKAPMHNMTRLPASVPSGAPFDGRTFHFKGDSATFRTVGGERFVQVDSLKAGSAIYRITKVIGGHYREDFAGQQVEAMQPGAKIVGDTHDELVMPVSYLLATGTLRYKGYSVMTPVRDALKAGPVWNRTCILCHNTAPYLTSMLGALAGPEAKAYQGEVVDPLLPASKRWSFTVTDEDGLKDALSAETSRLHGRTENLASKNMQSALITTVQATRSDLWQKDLVEVGIGCESCHGGAKEHVKNPSVKPSFAPHSPFVQVAGAHTEPQEITRACGRCHQVLYSGYTWTWEGGTRNDENNRGGSHINSGEARDFLLGHCAEKMSCVDCHEPHAAGNEARIRELEDTPAGNQVCLRCHQKYGTDDALRAHAHHDPKGEGGKCMNCHLPKKNMSLGGVTTRYHRIASPTDADKVTRDRPLECALCHEKKTVREILGDMKRLWGKSYDEHVVAALYDGNLDQNAITATLAAGKPHEIAPAAFVAGQTKMLAAAPLLAKEMGTGQYPIVRGYAQRALEALTGEASPVDPLTEDDAKIQEVTKAWLAKHDLSSSRNEATKR